MSPPTTGEVEHEADQGVHRPRRGSCGFGLRRFCACEPAAGASWLRGAAWQPGRPAASPVGLKREMLRISRLDRLDGPSARPAGPWVVPVWEGAASAIGLAAARLSRAYGVRAITMTALPRAWKVQAS